jgi:hypothetical protein
MSLNNQPSYENREDECTEKGKPKDCRYSREIVLVTIEGYAGIVAVAIGGHRTDGIDFLTTVGEHRKDQTGKVAKKERQHLPPTLALKE